MNEKQPEALRLAEIIGGNAAKELRRLHYMNSDLMKALRDIYYGSNDAGAVACAAAAITKSTGE